MKLSRQYLVGLGSGLILSALISLALPPVGVITGRGGGESGRAPTEMVKPSETSGAGTSSSAQSQGTAALSAENTLPKTASASGGSRPPAQTAKSAAREFTVPSGASAEKIAGLLQAQGFVSDKKAFLDAVEKKRAASRFQVGTFTLDENLSAEEIVDALLAPKGH